MNTYAHNLIACLVVLFASLSPALAQDDVRVTASVRTDRVFMGDELLIEVLVEGADDVRPFDAPPVPGATMRFLGGSNISRSFTMIVNGQRTENSTKGYSLQYALSPTRPGRIVVPPIEVGVGSETYRTEPIAIQAIEPQTDTEFALEVAIDEDRVYVGQPVRARVTWFIAAAVNEFSFRATPDPEGFDVYIPDTGQKRGRVIEFEIFGQRVTAVQSRATRGNESYPVADLRGHAHPSRDRHTLDRPAQRRVQPARLHARPAPPVPLQRGRAGGAPPARRGTPGRLHGPGRGVHHRGGGLAHQRRGRGSDRARGDHPRARADEPARRSRARRGPGVHRGLQALARRVEAPADDAGGRTPVYNHHPRAARTG